MVGHLLPGVGADKHLAGPGQAAQSGCGVDGVAGQRIGAGACVAAAGDDQAGVDSGVHAEARPARRRTEVDDQPVDRGVQLERGRDGAPWVVATRQRHAEESHDLVADKLVHRAAVALDHGGRLVLDPAHDRFDLLGVGRLVQGGVAGQVGEHHRRVATLAGSTAAGAAAAVRAPQPLQKRWPSWSAAPQFAQAACRGAPQALQNRAPTGFSASQRAQGMGRWQESSGERSIIAGSRRRRQASAPPSVGYCCAPAGSRQQLSRAKPGSLRVSPSRNTIIGFSAVGLQGPRREAASAFWGPKRPKTR